METLAGFPYMKAKFDKHAKALDPNLTQTVNHWISTLGSTDLLVFSHGWNNDIAEAGELYQALATSLDNAGAKQLVDRKLAILGVFWPSKKFAASELIPGGAASEEGDLDDAELRADIEQFRSFIEDEKHDELDAMRSQVATLSRSPTSRAQFFRHARGLLDPPDAMDLDDSEEIPAEFFATDEDADINDFFNRLRNPDPPNVSSAPSASGAAGFSGSGFKAGARRLLNYVTYYKMKARARTIGNKAVSPLLRQLRKQHPSLRLHLVGHSFGGLVVTAAALGEAGQAAIPVASMSLLQAAFSHNGFASKFGEKGKQGHYRGVVTRGCVSGPILITHTHNDKAVGLAYALASRFSGVDAAGIGDKDDPYGGIGANGAQNTPESVEVDLEATGFAYSLVPGKLYNLLADKYVKDHSGIRGPEIGHAIVQAVKVT